MHPYLRALIVFLGAISLINRRSHLFHTNLSTNDTLAKSISIADFASLHSPRSFVVLGESNNRFERLASTISPHNCSVGDRFIPRRKGVSNDVSHYRLLHADENDQDADYLDVFKEVTNATQHWRKKYMDTAFKVFGIFNGLQSDRILNIGKSSAIDFKSLKIRDCADDCGWACRPRKQPLLNMKGEDSTRYRDHGAQIFRFAMSIRFKNLIDWGARNILACGLADQFCICDVDIKSIAKVYRVKYKSYLCCVKWNPDGTKVAVSGLDGSTSLYDENYGQIIWSTQCPCYVQIRCTCKITCTEWVTKYNHVITGCDKGCLSIINSQDGKLLTSKVFKKEIIAISLSPTEQYLVVSGEDKLVKLFSYPSLTPIFEIVFYASVKAIAWHPWQTSILCIGGGPGDGSLSLWNVSSQRQLGYRKIKFVGSVDRMMFNKLSGELVVHWYFLDNHRLRSKIVVMTSLDKIVDAVPVHPDHRMLNIVWSPDHKRLAMQHRDTLVIWNFFGNDLDKWSRKNSKRQAEKAENSLRNYSLETPTSAGLYSGLASARRGKNFSYYNIR